MNLEQAKALGKKEIHRSAAKLKFETRNLIDGKFVAAAQGKTFESINPATNCFDHGDMTQPWGGYKQSGDRQSDRRRYSGQGALDEARASAEGEGVGLHPGIEETDLEGAVDDGAGLPDQLIEPLPGNDTLAIGERMLRMSGAASAPDALTATYPEVLV